MELFDEMESADFELISITDGLLKWMPRMYSRTEADRYLSDLQVDIEWKQQSIKIFGKETLQPRLTAWYGDSDAVYTYSGLRFEPLPWSPLLLRLKRDIEEKSGHQFNSVLLNLYRDGQDSMGWHSDDEAELGDNPVIGSLNFGASRKFHLRHKFDKEEPKQSFELSHGSLLVMEGRTQHYWQHQVPKTKRIVGKRVNLTFRWVYPRI